MPTMLPTLKLASTIKARLLLALCSLSLLLVVCSGAGWFAASSSHGSLREVYQHRVVPLRDLKIVADLYAVSIVDASHKARNGNMTLPEGLKAIETARTGITEGWNRYLAGVTDPAERKQAEATVALMRAADATIAKLTGALTRNERALLTSVINEELYDVIDPVSESVSKLVDLQLDESRTEYARSQANAATATAVMTTGLVLGALAIVFALFTVIAQVIRPLVALTGLTSRLAQGDLSVEVTGAGRADEIGTLARALQVFKDNALEVRRRAADEEAERAGRERRAAMRARPGAWPTRPSALPGRRSASRAPRSRPPPTSRRSPRRRRSSPSPCARSAATWTARPASPSRRSTT
jgi:methyl-accepting chemotaxis protein